MTSNGRTRGNGNANCKDDLSQLPVLDDSYDQISGIPPFPPLNINDAAANDNDNKNDNTRERTTMKNMESHRNDRMNYSNAPRQTLTPPRSHSAESSPSQNPNYMSEPSVSEDGTGASSAQYTSTHTSPLNQAIHMNDSPSNTSLSSLGSPGVNSSTAVRKKMNFSQLAPMGTLLSPIEANSDPDSNGDASINLKENGMISSGVYNYQQLKDDNDIQHVDDDDDDDDGGNDDDGDDNGDDHNIKSRQTMQDATPESQRYFSAQEESEEENDGSSCDISYDSSSQEEQIQNQGKQGRKQKKYSKLRTPPSTDNAPIDVDPSYQQPNYDKQSKDTDEEFLLKNTDFGIMDLSSKISTVSPGKRRIINSFKISTPPKMTSFQSLEEEITPRRKTSGTSSANDSLTSTPSISPNRRLSKSMSLPGDIQLVENFSDSDSIAIGVDMNMNTKRRRKLSDPKRHHRTRSGDGVAATLLTGSSEWAGMEFHQLPLPEDRDADDDDDHDDEENLIPNHSADQSLSWDQMHSPGTRKNQRRKPMRKGHTSSDDALVRQSISADDVDLMMAMARSPNVLEEGISSRFSPRVAGGEKSDSPNRTFNSALYPRYSGLERNYSFGDVSASTAESSFSWISRGTATIAKGLHPNLAKGSPLPSNKNSTSSTLTPPIENKPHAAYGMLQPVAIPCTAPSIDRDIEMQAEQTKKEDAFDAHMRELRNAPPSPIIAPKLHANSSKVYPTFTCPRCKTVQREFFTVASAPSKFRSPAQYIVLYFFMYMIMSLFLFGMEEGWPPLDCVYFSVTTLTTTGLGDYVPTSDSAKIICSIFIYFGVSCIGLLLGSMHVTSLDDAAKKQAKENMINNCPNCARLQSRVHSQQTGGDAWPFPRKNGPRKRKEGVGFQDEAAVNETTSLLQLDRTTEPASSRFSQALNTIDEAQKISPITQKSMSPGSAPVESMGRQSHTRHISLDSPGMKNIFDPNYTNFKKKMEMDTTRHAANSNVGNGATSFKILPTNFRSVDDNISDIENDEHNSLSSVWSADENEFFTPVSKIKAAKYVFLTLKQAFTNSLFVVMIGSVGFYYIESMTVVDSFYFTTVLLTTVGYGDIVPETPEGKLFCTVYGLIAGAVLLHQMSMISMIPLELRKRRIERQVLMQFGDELDDTALEELATGPLMKRLQITENSPEGMGQCTREMFALAMLVRLGRITEQDVRSTFAAFKRLDKDNNGLLTSKEIIMNTVERKKKEQKVSPRDTGSLLPKQENVSSAFLGGRSPPSRSRQSYIQRQETRMGKNRAMSVESNFSAITYEEGDGDYHQPYMNEGFL